MMDKQDYDIWAMRLNQAIRSRRREEGGEVETKPRTLKDAKELLIDFAREAAAVVGAIGRNIEDVEIQGNDRLSTLDGFLDEMLRFEDFSFLEYRYIIPSKQQPGLRFKVETEGGGRVVNAYFFQDLVFWPVDEEGKRIFSAPIKFILAEGKITAQPSPDMADFYVNCANWQAALRETLTLPFRHLYETKRNLA